MSGKFRLLASVTVLWFALAGCGDGKTNTKTISAKTDHAHGHEHHAPHGGTLVVLGEEFAHFEVLLDAASGKLSLYVLDREPDSYVRVKHPELELEIVPSQGEAFSVRLKAAANPLTGETAGDTSQFEGQDDRLKGLKDFDAEAPALEIRGQKVGPTKFNFPKGNEKDNHAHDKTDGKKT